MAVRMTSRAAVVVAMIVRVDAGHSRTLYYNIADVQPRTFCQNIDFFDVSGQLADQHEAGEKPEYCDPNGGDDVGQRQDKLASFVQHGRIQ